MKALFFVFDSLRADHVSCYGHSKQTTPNIDRLSSDGIVFENAFSQAIWTGPSSSAILTSQYPLVNNFGYISKTGDNSQEFLPTPFEGTDIETGAITSLHQARDTRLADGFDSHIDMFDVKSPTSADYPSVLADTVIEWVDDHKMEDFVLFVWWMGTHSPFTTPPDYERKLSDSSGQAATGINYDGRDDPNQVRDLYDETIRYNDREFGRITKYLKKQELYDDAVVAVTSDHGEVFDEHGRLEHISPKVKSLCRATIPKNIQSKYNMFSGSGYAGHQQILPYDELLHVPLVLKLPDNRCSNTREEELVETIDITPTIHELMDVPQLPAAQGHSLLDLVEDGNTIHEYVYSSNPMLYSKTLYNTIRNEEHKYIRLEENPINVRENIRYRPSRTLYSYFSNLVQPDKLLFDVTEGETTNLAD
ncbi:hypothetical protein EXE43_11210 [Halorubrum sp. SS5]|nr:hypothetical protein EXE43_11210 [Halorubrum sp. SS5]